ncbi:transcription termination factor NusA [Spiroplasma endosymbiont of Aspidapion aeneum]|uniref:transcription termination factor NusA n=1 Tax=Spiroplasma endosymbiont of Aspidapion aeneum TaxID=3066276 RepID=UPI00313DDCAB
MFNSAWFIDSVMDIVREKQIDKEVIFDGIRDGFKKAYEKYFDPEAIIEVDINEEEKEIKVWKLLTIVEEVDDDWLEISQQDAKKLYQNDNIGDIVREPIDINTEFSNLAVLKVGQAVKQKIRDAEKSVIFNKFTPRIGEIASGIVKDITEKSIILSVDGLTLPFWNMKLIPGENFGVGDRVFFYIEFVDKDNKFQQVGLTRIHPRFIERLMEIEIPEITSGLVNIMKVAREPGFRSKVAVRSNDPNIDPIGCCIGPNGSRINGVLKELYNEKIDIVLYDDDKDQYIMNALSPARVVSIQKKEGVENQYIVIVPEQHISLAIGRGGYLVKVVAKLAETKIDIYSVEQAKSKGIEIIWNGNLSEKDLEAGKWLQEKNFKNWGNKLKQTVRPISKQVNDYLEESYLNLDTIDFNDNYDTNSADDDFYNLDHEDYLTDDED